MGTQHRYKLGLLTFLCCGGLIKENGHRIPNHGQTLRRLQYKDNALHLINIKQTPPFSIQFNTHTHTQQQHTFLNLESNQMKEKKTYLSWRDGFFLFLGLFLPCSVQFNICIHFASKIDQGCLHFKFVTSHHKSFLSLI